MVHRGHRRSHHPTRTGAFRCKAHGRYNRRVALQSRPDALPATGCAGRDPQRRKGHSEIQGSVANVSDGPLRPPQGGLSFSFTSSRMSAVGPEAGPRSQTPRCPLSGASEMPNIAPSCTPRAPFISCGAKASSFDAVSAALPSEAAEIAASRHRRRHKHSRHRLRWPALVFGTAAEVQHFPCRRHRTSPS